MITLTLIAVFAQTGFAADRPGLLPEAEIGRYGLERAWYSQITMDGRMTKMEHTLLDRNLFFVITDKNDLITLDAETGQILWSRRTGDSDLKPYAPAVNSRTVAVVCGNEVQVFDRRNGRLLWHQVLPAPASAACQLTNYYLYVPLVDHRMACFPMEELKAPSAALWALVPQYEAIGYTLDPFTGRVSKTSTRIVSTEELVTSQKGEKKPAPSQRLLGLVPQYAAVGMILDPYTGEVREAGKTVASWWEDNIIEINNAPLKGKKELDDLLEKELSQWDKSRRQERKAGLLGEKNQVDLEEDVNSPFFLKPYMSTPLFCYSFGTTTVQPMISFDSADVEVLTWFSDRGYLFFTNASHAKDKTFALRHRIAVTPVLSYKTESKTSRYEGSIARDIVYQPTVVQKNLDNDTSRFLTVVGSASGLVFAYDSKTSETRWWQTVGSPISNRLTTVRDRIYVPCMDNSFYCLDSKQGDVLWSSPGIASFIAASPDWLYVRNTSGELVRVNPQDGAQTTLFSLKAYKDVYNNNENDRIYLITNTGLILCLHEMEREQPVRHTYLPEAYLTYKETDEERRLLIEMPEIANGVRQQPQQTPKVGTRQTTTAPESTLFDDDDSTPGPNVFDGGFTSPVPTTPAVEQPKNSTPADDDWGIDFGGTEF